MFRQFWCLWLTGILLLVQASSAAGEWYLGGYGGYNAPSSLKDVTMNNFGYQSAVARYGFSQTDATLGSQLTQNFQTSDVSLKNSFLFGGKAGYFFSDQGLPWLGLELEAFTTKPTIKQQTVDTTQDITFALSPSIPPVLPCSPPPAKTCSQQEQLRSTLNLSESSMRLITVAFNVVARYPGKVFQPYIGVGAGAFYFSSSGQISGRQVVPGLNTQAGLKLLVTEEWGLFVEGKYNYATISSLDPTFGLSGVYSAFSGLAGIAYHF
jgi:outer membrane protein W